MIDFPAANDKPFSIPFGGGLDTETPVASIAPGNVIGSDGYEPKVGGGYARLGGIERFDGHPSPSAAPYQILSVAGLTGTLNTGDVVLGTPSTATGTVAWFGDGILAVIKTTGTFVSGDTLTVGGLYRGVGHTEPPVQASQVNEIEGAAADILRADIGKVPGYLNTPVRGVGVLYGVLYAFRDFDALTQKVYKSTATGWQEVPLLQRIAFTAGTALVKEGDTLSKGGVTATVRRVVVQAGDWSGGSPASGWLIISGATGTFTAGAATSSPSSGAVTLSGAQAQITLTAGGRWELKPHNFSGGLTMRLYGADGVNDLIEFDGTVLAPIPVAMPVKPKFLEFFASYLWAAFGTSIQRSGINNPYAWTVLSGSAEIAMGDLVTGLQAVSGSETAQAMLVTAENLSAVIYGDATTFKLSTLSTEVGAKPYTLQEIGKVIALDAAGMRDFTPTNAFGNFKNATLTDHIRRKATNLTARASIVSKATGRYRLFLNDGTMMVGAPGKRWAWQFCQIPWGVNVAAEGEVGGLSQVFLGCDDGYVRVMDVGRSLDGAEFEYWLKFPFTQLGAPGFVKKVAHINAELAGQSYGQISAQIEVDYGSADAIDTLPDRLNIPPPASLWDISLWDMGVWDGQAGQTVRIRVRAKGENFSLTLFNESATELPHEVHSAVVWHRVLKRAR